MHITVMVEKIGGNGFRARDGEPLGLIAEGPTSEAAVSNLRKMISARLSNGTELIALELPEPEHPLARFCGSFKGDPMVAEWEQIMAENRRKADEDPDVL